MLVFNNYFYKNRKSKLYFEDRVAVLNDSIYQTCGSITLLLRCPNQVAYSPTETVRHGGLQTC
jgi:hypothetical protein